MTDPKFRMAKPEHQVAFQDIRDLLGRHGDKVDALEMLALTANMLGRLAAMQDQRRYSGEQIMKIVADNIQIGNAQMVAELRDKQAGSA